MDATVDDEHALVRALRMRPHRYSFFQALRDLEVAHVQLPRIGRALGPGQEAFRVRQIAKLTFAPTAIEATELDDAGRLSIDQRCFGLLGPSGPLPTHFTEIVRSRARHADDAALKEFLDIFHHRMATLFYRAWSSARPAVQRDRPMQDRFAVYLGSLAGVGLIHARSRDAWTDEGKQYFTGCLGSLRRNSEGLEAILGRTFSVPVRIQPFVLRQMQLPDCEVSQLGGSGTTKSAVSKSSNALGQSAVLGSRVADRQSYFEIALGPMAYPTFERLMPKQPQRQTIAAVVKNYAGVGIDARVRLVLKGDQVPRPQLGAAGRLGRDAWIQSRPIDRDREDYSFEVDSLDQTHSQNREVSPS